MPNIGLLEIVMVVTIAVLVVALVVRLISGPRAARTTASDPATDALRVRLANGEIDDLEYERLRTMLLRR